MHHARCSMGCKHIAEVQMEGTMTEITEATKRNIFTQKLAIWRNTKFSAEVDVELAGVLQDDEMATQAQALLKRAIQATKMLERKLEELKEQ